MLAIDSMGVSVQNESVRRLLGELEAIASAPIHLSDLIAAVLQHKDALLTRLVEASLPEGFTPGDLLVKVSLRPSGEAGECPHFTIGTSLPNILRVHLLP